MMQYMSYLEPIGNIGGIAGPPAPPSPQAEVVQAPAAPKAPSPSYQRTGYSLSPDSYPGQPTFPSPNADLKGYNSNPPNPMRGLAAAQSADGIGIEGPEIPRLDTSATDPRPYGPWPGSSRPVGGIDAAPGPYYLGGPGATPTRGIANTSGVRPIAGIGAQYAQRPIQVGRRSDPLPVVRRDPGVAVRIPVDQSGRFGPINLPAIQDAGQNGWSDRGVPAFGNVASMSRTMPWRNTNG